MCLCGAGDDVRVWSVEGVGGTLAHALGKRGQAHSLTVVTGDWGANSQVLYVHT